MSISLGERIRMAFAPPRYLASPLAGIDLSTSGVKAVRLKHTVHGLALAAYAENELPTGAFTDGEIVDRAAVIKSLVATADALGISSAIVALSESKSYLFETTVVGQDRLKWRVDIEQHLDELVPLPPAVTVFDAVPVGRTGEGNQLVEGIGFANRIVDDTLSVFDEAGIMTRALESENFAMARALLPINDQTTALVIDVGKTTTKICVVSNCIPRFATTIGIGGNSLTLAVQKYFGVTEKEARRVKIERGIVPALGNEEYLAAMLSTVSAIRDEIYHRLEYWQSKAAPGSTHEPVSHAILVGGNASVRGFPEYLESVLRIPVATGNVFTNLASPNDLLPPISFGESLAYATAIGLALYDLQRI